MRGKTEVKPNTQGLLAHAQRKSQQTRQRVHQVIDRLLREQQAINFNTVAHAAQVTKSYLYAHQEVRERIERPGEEQMKKEPRLSHHLGGLDASWLFVASAGASASGKPFFQDVHEGVRFKLIETQQSRSGVVLLRSQRA